ncbi:DUF4198 domain-containing protein [Desulfonatronospira sp.]|uniref:DUF4198 domain-containing protein n=1 Tax=Desulfonatronospira sp. TaxID=1962951 RepID=UPI0025BA8D01|nr:DUF4198 domain-containing protein [Desulfonatronospira sp.]
MFRWSLTALTTVFFLSVAAAAHAHCIWSEPPYRVDPGDQIIVDVFYADPDDPLDERDKTNMSLYVLSPGGETTDAALNELDTYYQAAVSFEDTGMYTLILERDPNRYRLQEIRDFGKSIVWSGQDGGLVHDPVGIPLEIVPVEAVELDNGELKLVLQVLYEGNPVSEGDVEVFRALSNDDFLYEEIDEVDIGSDGRLELVIDPAHNHVLETDYYVPAGEVEGTGFAINEVRFRSTMFIAGQ